MNNKPTTQTEAFDDGDLLVGRPHGASADDDREIELDEDDLLEADDEDSADEGDLDFEPDDRQ